MKVIPIVLLMAVIVGGGIGWIQNLIKLTECDFEAPYKAEVIHTAGLIPPIGAITGWLDLGK
jgi:uncharacterized membrane protein YheB (UPF0754 family)